MSLWTSLRDTAESAASTILSPIDFRGESARKQSGGVTGFLNRARSAEESGFNAVTGRTSSSDKRIQTQQINDQIQAYKDQTAITQKQIDSVKAEKDAEKRKINEKQIRSLRSSNRSSSGFLNSSGAPSSSNAGLGDSTGIPGKLGAA